MKGGIIMKIKVTQTWSIIDHVTKYGDFKGEYEVRRIKHDEDVDVYEVDEGQTFDEFVQRFMWTMNGMIDDCYQFATRQTAPDWEMLVYKDDEGNTYSISFEVA